MARSGINDGVNDDLGKDLGFSSDGDDDNDRVRNKKYEGRGRFPTTKRQFY